MGQAFGCLQVDQSNVIIREHFGKFDDVLEPGCHCLPWCLGYQVAGGLSLRVQQLDVRCETKTKDNVFVTVVASVQYRAVADKASDAFYRLTNTREQIQSYVFDVIRASVPKLNLDAVFEQKNDIAKSVEDELEKAMSTYGYEIVQTLIVDIEPDPHVKRAMNEINAAARMRVAANDKAGNKDLTIIPTSLCPSLSLYALKKTFLPNPNPNPSSPNPPGFAMKGAKSRSEPKKAESKLSVKKGGASTKAPAGRKGKAAKDPNKPKRPASAFFVFMEEFRKQFNKDHPENKSVSAVGKAAGAKWKSMSEAEKAPYVAKAEKRKVDYEKNMKAYNKKQAEGANAAEDEVESEKSMSEVNDDDEGDEDGSEEEDDDE